MKQRHQKSNIMVAYYKNILAVEVGWLIDNDIVSEVNYRNLSYRNQIRVLRRGCKNSPALVAYDSMPERFRRRVDEVLGRDPYELVKVNVLEEYIREDVEVSGYFDSYQLEDGRYLPRETRREYYVNAIVLAAVGRLVKDKRARRRVMGQKRTGIWDKITEAVNELDRARWGHTLPSNQRRLQERYKRLEQEGLESLIHKNFTNKNAAKVDDELKESYLIELIGSPKNLDNAQVARLYNMLAEQMGWMKIGRESVARYREKHYATTYAGRRGATAHSNRVSMQVRRSAPTAPLYYWTLDGWDVELLYQSEDGGYHHRPTLVVVLDPSADYPIGYAVGRKETPELITAALRNAVKHTEELFGQKYRAHQVQSDRYAIKKMTPYYAAIGDKVTPARARNAKAKVIESYFSRINKKWFQLLYNWSGFGITSDREKQPNVDHLNKIRKELPDYEGVVKQVEMIMERERAEKRDEYLRMWSELDAEKKLSLSTEDYLLQFGSSTGRRILMQPSGLHMTIRGLKRTYDSFDVEFRDHSSTRWLIMYDPEDMALVLAVNEDETRRYLLEEKYVQPMALADRKKGDAEELQRVREFNKRYDEEISNRRGKSGSMVYEHMNSSRMIEDETLSKLLLVNSAGQHKDEKNKTRLNASAKDVDYKEVDEAQDWYEKY